MHQEGAKTFPQSRPLTEDEGALLRWLLEHGAATPAEKAQLRFVSVVGRCGCGCARGCLCGRHGSRSRGLVIGVGSVLAQRDPDIYLSEARRFEPNG